MEAQESLTPGGESGKYRLGPAPLCILKVRNDRCNPTSIPSVVIPLNANLTVATTDGPEMAIKEAEASNHAEQAPEPHTRGSRRTDNRTPCTTGEWQC